MPVILIILAVILFALSVPPMRSDPSLRKFCYSFFVSLFGVTLPLVVFFLSTFMAPDSKSGCTNGWIDCFYASKLALTPVVLWATGSLYVVELFKFERLTRYGVTLGLFLGSITAFMCSLFGMMFLTQLQMAALWYLVPLYVAVWHGWRAWQLIGRFNMGVKPLLVSALCTVPLWIWSIIWAKMLYTSLPETSGCFVVTSASRGHTFIVGPQVAVRHDGQLRFANQQLATFWRFEELWQQHSLRSHKLFRRIYNRVGPQLARHIQHPVIADAAYLTLKPIELLARSINRMAKP